MAHIHCILLSQQHVPNLLGIHALNPDRIVMLESDAMKRASAAEGLLAALELGGLSYRGRCDVINLSGVDDITSLQAALRQAYAIGPQAQWSCNITGGTKIMSIAAYEYFKALGASLYYVESSKPDDLIPIHNAIQLKCNHRLGLAEFCAGYGFDSAKSDKDSAIAENSASDWWECSRLLAQHATTQSVLCISDRDRWEEGRKKGLELAAGELRIMTDGLSQQCADRLKLTRQGESLIGKVNKCVFRFLSGEWLECFIWGLLQKHAVSLGLWDVRLGFKPQKVGSKTDNDFDVAFMRDYALCMVECKTGSQEHDKNADILYKIDSVTRMFRALHVWAFLATTSDSVLDKQGVLKEGLRNRAANLGCTIILRDAIRAMAANPGDLSCIKKAFKWQ